MGEEEASTTTEVMDGRGLRVAGSDDGGGEDGGGLAMRSVISEERLEGRRWVGGGLTETEGGRELEVCVEEGESAEDEVGETLLVDSNADPPSILLLLPPPPMTDVVSALSPDFLFFLRLLDDVGGLSAPPAPPPAPETLTTVFLREGLAGTLTLPVVFLLKTPVGLAPAAPEAARVIRPVVASAVALRDGVGFELGKSLGAGEGM